MITVLTAITNNKDNLKDDFPKSEAKYVAFLDEDTELETSSDLWEIKKVSEIHVEPRRNAKIHKIMPHLFVDTDYSIWLDGNISLNITPEELVEKWLQGKDIATWKHFARNCLYSEGTSVLGVNYDKQGLVKEQMERYKKEGYPSGAGLSECNVIVRKHTPEINRLNERWWAEICRGSSRDQVSFPYVFRDKVNRIAGNPRDHSDFKYAKHNYLEQNYAKENSL